MKSLSVVIPAMNEEETIRDVLRELRYTIENYLKDYQVEVIVVDDHSTDRTSIIAREYGANVIPNLYHPGKGNALRCGFERTTGDWIAMLDADGSHKAMDLPILLKPMEDGAGFVIGSRILGGSDEYTRTRAFGNIFLTFAFGYFHGRYLSDALNGFKVFRREVFFNSQYTSSDFEIEIELLANALRNGYSVVEVPSHERQRQGGKTKSKVFRHGIKFLIRVIQEAWKNHHKIEPHLPVPVTANPNSRQSHIGLLTRNLDNLQTLYTITRVIASELDPHELLLGDLQSVLELLNATSGSIVLLDGDGKVVEGFWVNKRYAYPLQTSQAMGMIKNGLLGWVIEHQKSTLVRNTHNDPRWLRRPWDEIEDTARSAISVPILFNNRVIGVLTLVRPRNIEFTIDDLVLLSGVFSNSHDNYETVRLSLVNQSEYTAPLI